MCFSNFLLSLTLWTKNHYSIISLVYQFLTYPVLTPSLFHLQCTLMHFHKTSSGDNFTKNVNISVRSIRQLCFWRFSIIYLTVDCLMFMNDPVKSTFSQKGVMHLSFLQTGEPNYFPEQEFWFFFHSKGLKSYQIRTWSCSECSKKVLEQLQVFIWHELSHLQKKIKILTQENN